MDNIPNPPIITRLCSDSEAFIFTHGIKVYNETFPKNNKDKVNIKIIKKSHFITINIKYLRKIFTYK